jgi:hypothetical protein
MTFSFLDKSSLEKKLDKQFKDQVPSQTARKGNGPQG